MAVADVYKSFDPFASPMVTQGGRPVEIPAKKVRTVADEVRGFRKNNPGPRAVRDRLRELFPCLMHEAEDGAGYDYLLSLPFKEALSLEADAQKAETDAADARWWL